MAKTPPPEYDGSTPLGDPKQEFFCELFTTNTLARFWGNGTNSYAFSYGYTEKINELKAGIAGTKKMRKGKSKVDCEREIEKMENVCAASASRLLTNVKVKLRNGYLLDQLAVNTIVDRELVYLIQQREDTDVKMAAIAHHDKRTQRIKDTLDIKHQFEPITGINFLAPAKKK